MFFFTNCLDLKTCFYPSIKISLIIANWNHLAQFCKNLNHNAHYSANRDHVKISSCSWQCWVRLLRHADEGLIPVITSSINITCHVLLLKKPSSLFKCCMLPFFIMNVPKTSFSRTLKDFRDLGILWYFGQK